MRLSLKKSRIVFGIGLLLVTTLLVAASAFALWRRPARPSYDPAAFQSIDQLIALNKCAEARTDLKILANTETTAKASVLQGQIAFREGDCALRDKDYSGAVTKLRQAVDQLPGEEHQGTVTVAKRLLVRAELEQINEVQRDARKKSAPPTQPGGNQ